MKRTLFTVFILSITLLQGISIAQGLPSFNLGTLRVPPHSICKFGNDYEQAVCSGVCGVEGKSWIVAKMPKYDDEGELLEYGEGDCE